MGFNVSPLGGFTRWPSHCQTTCMKHACTSVCEQTGACLFAVGLWESFHRLNISLLHGSSTLSITHSLISFTIVSFLLHSSKSVKVWAGKSEPLKRLSARQISQCLVPLFSQRGVMTLSLINHSRSDRKWLQTSLSDIFRLRYWRKWNSVVVCVNKTLNYSCEVCVAHLFTSMWNFQLKKRCRVGSIMDLWLTEHLWAHIWCILFERCSRRTQPLMKKVLFLMQLRTDVG